jgi:SAM-dependent methyltransferase
LSLAGGGSRPAGLIGTWYVFPVEHGDIPAMRNSPPHGPQPLLKGIPFKQLLGPSTAHSHMTRQDHWNQVYQTKATDDVSWYQRRPDLSLALIAASGVSKGAGIIDVGGGASTLVDFLLDDDFAPLAVLDLSGAALAQSRSRLGARAEAVEWFEADVTSFEPPHRFGLWHDRAVLHFLTAADDRRGYVATLRRTLQPGGAVIISTFAPDGPPKCSGLEVRRYDEQSIQQELGVEFQLQEVRRETHVTPWQSEQRFIYFRFQRQT